MTPVLLASPDRALADALAFALELEGFQVTATTSADGALALAPAPPVQLVIDHRPPELCAVALLGRLGPAAAQRRRVVVLATHPSPALRAAADRAGAVVIEKPLLGDALVDALHADPARRPLPSAA